MAQTRILIDYDLETHEIRRIIHPHDDSHIRHHPVMPGWGRVEARHKDFPVDHATGKPMYSLSQCADAIERVTGRRPPNG